MFILEGNIGAGKTTLLNKIKEHGLGNGTKSLQPIEVVFEPVNSWHKQKSGQSLLTNFYADIPRWGYTLETYAMACRVREHIAEQAKNNPFKLIERSIYSGHYCFAHNSYHNGGMSRLEWLIYNQWFHFLVRNKCQAPLGFIYLTCDPATCLERIKLRNRAGEDNISLQYLEQIHERHEIFLSTKKDITTNLKSVPVLTLDGTKPFATDNQIFEQYYETMNSFMCTICTQHHNQNNSKKTDVSI